MYPAAFDYLAPTTLDEALDALAEHGEDGRVLAGGQSLIPMMKFRLAVPEVLIDLNRIPGLDTIEVRDGHLRIGALVRHADVEVDDTVRAHSPLVADTAPSVADPLVRNRGTVCGSVAHCDPEGDWNSVVLALRGRVVARDRDGERSIAIDDFIRGLFTNALEPGELVTAVDVPIPAGRSGGAYLKLKRKVGDYATVAVATHLELADDGTIAQAGIALTAVGPHNLRVTAAEDLLRGERPSAELFAEAAEAAARTAEPTDDVRGPAEYKRDVVRVYTRRGLQQCLDRADAD